MKDLTGLSPRQGLEKAIICNNEIVNVVSSKYGHLPNEDFFLQATMKLDEAGINYDTRSIARGNRSFAVDYILNDPSINIEVKGNNDIIKPMIRLVNSYDGSSKTHGSFGYFRQVCSNGLHINTTKIAFNIKHHSGISEVVMPEIDKLVKRFIDNEYYTLRRRFEVLAETLVENPLEYIKEVCNATKVFQYQASDKNTGPSANSRLVLNIAHEEASHLGSPINKWLIYNAFNNVLHNKLQKTFQSQQAIDTELFTFINSN
jgi:hypothetical protein